MKYKPGDIVYFNNISDKTYAWNLHKHQCVEVSDHAIDTDGSIFYGVKTNNSYQSWYIECDLLSVKELRTIKLNKIKYENNR